MHNKGEEPVVFDDHRSTIKAKTRQVSSRFLSPTSSPNNTVSPLPQKTRCSFDSRKHKSLENSLGLWPSSSNTKNPETLATHRDISHQNFVLEKQRSCTEFSRFENGKQSGNTVFGGSMRGKFKFPGNVSSKDISLIDTQNGEHVLPGRFSVDENVLQHNQESESDSEYSDILSGRTSFETPAGKHLSFASYMASTVSSRKHGLSSKLMQNLMSRSQSQRWSTDSGTSISPKTISLENAMKTDRASSRDRKGNPKPPTSPKCNRVGNIFSRGIELLKGKKYTTRSRSPVGPGSVESIHELRLLHNRLNQWRYTNAKADLVNRNVIKHAQNNLIWVWNGIAKLQHSVVSKKLQVQMEKLQLKLNYILYSQMKALESWKNVETEYSSAISATKDYLHFVICKIPLVDGAKVDPQSVSRTVRHASDVAASINLTILRLSPAVEETAGVLVTLAKVINQEKLLLEECLDLYRIVSALQTRERSLKSSIMQLLQTTTSSFVDIYELDQVRCL